MTVRLLASFIIISILVVGAAMPRSLEQRTLCERLVKHVACAQTSKIGELSDGIKSRLVFGMICMARPNMLLLDEPTNHLDIECIDSLAEAIKRFQGGLVLVSHDFRLIDQVRSRQPLGKGCQL